MVCQKYQSFLVETDTIFNIRATDLTWRRPRLSLLSYLQYTSSALISLSALRARYFLCELFSSGLAETYPTAYQELGALATPLAPARDRLVESGS